MRKRSRMVAVSAIVIVVGASLSIGGGQAAGGGQGEARRTGLIDELEKNVEQQEQVVERLRAGVSAGYQNTHDLRFGLAALAEARGLLARASGDQEALRQALTERVAHLEVAVEGLGRIDELTGETSEMQERLNTLARTRVQLREAGG